MKINKEMVKDEELDEDLDESGGDIDEKDEVKLDEDEEVEIDEEI